LNKWNRIAFIALAVAWILPLRSAPAPAYVDMTWMSIANMYYEIGSLKILTDGYISRVPQSEFYGGGSGLAQTRDPFKPDVAAVTRVMQAIGGASSINLLLTGHSHFDHSFDTATWARLTGARIIGPMTTCYQAMAEKISSDRCTAVYGAEKLTLADGVTMRVVRWNHSGDSVMNPEQHNPVELGAVPVPDSTSGGLHAGVAEDFPNGGGARGFLFTVDTTDGRLSWYYQNSASASDLTVPILVDGKNYGAPLDNLKAAMKDAGLDSIDLWIGTGGAAIAQLVAPVIKPKTYLPVHWDGLFGAFNAGVPSPYSDPALERFLMQSNITLIRPGQYMDKWRLDRNGMRPIANTEVKRALGFSETAGTTR
jgi:L-ascorbate metabolism protein UlaG (beta-lactamase superfamily)